MSGKSKSSKDIFLRERLMINFSHTGINNLITLGRINYLNAHKPLDKHTHKDSMEICYLARGRQTYSVGDKPYTLKGGDIFITFPDEEHSTGINVEERSILYYLIFDIKNNLDNFLGYKGEEGRELALALNNMSRVNRHFAGNSEIRSILDEVFLTFYSAKKFKKIVMQGLISKLFIRIIELENNRKNSFPEDISKTINYINDNIQHELRLDKLASDANLSLSRFKQKFKEAAGIPPGEYIKRAKVDFSKHLLKDSDSTITEISYQLGFSSSQYYAMVFKKFKGITPKDFRIRVRKDSNYLGL
ncbi:MAG TPA: AraC family transcriptional regulator [Clostridiales bacterium]|nr:AraC family transcriptional regulator [Clostridiales bacterium]